MDAKTANRTGFLIYKSYNFVDKDPVIDAMRTAFSDSGHTYQYVHDQSGVSISTMNAWFLGSTRRPTLAAMAAVGSVIGCEGYNWKTRKLIGKTRRRSKKK